MTSENKIKNLKDKGWVLTFDKDKWEHIATRGFIRYKSNSITNLYKQITNGTKQD